MAHNKRQRGFETTLAFLRCELSKAHLFIPALYLSLLHTIRSAKGKPVFLLCEITQDTLQHPNQHFFGYAPRQLRRGVSERKTLSI